MKGTKEIEMENAINKLFEAIADDYLQRSIRSEYYDSNAVKEFRENLTVEEGRKYLKIVKTLGTQELVWGFIVKKDDKKFRAGDILKAASWAAPARNKPRGNILEGDFSWVRWTGPEYL